MFSQRSIARILCSEKFTYLSIVIQQFLRQNIIFLKMTIISTSNLIFLKRRMFELKNSNCHISVNFQRITFFVKLSKNYSLLKSMIRSQFFRNHYFSYTLSSLGKISLICWRGHCHKHNYFSKINVPFLTYFLTISLLLRVHSIQCFVIYSWNKREFVTQEAGVQ